MRERKRTFKGCIPREIDLPTDVQDSMDALIQRERCARSKEVEPSHDPLDSVRLTLTSDGE